MAIGIYKIQNKLNNKIYIGQSIDIARRWKQHIAASKDIKHPLYFDELYKDFRKYGIDNFDFSIVEETTKNRLNDRELYWMKYYNSLQHGYNINAAAGQKICLEDTIADKQYFFSTFKQVEDWLRSNNITKSQGLTPFLKRNLKQKNLIYNKFYIYYWRN